MKEMESMKKMTVVLSILLSFGFWKTAYGQATPAPTTSVSTTTSSDENASFEAQKHKLELEQLELQNEKVKLEMKQIQSESEMNQAKEKKENSKEELAIYQTDESKKAEALAQENKDKADLLVLDLVNAEVWYKGVRYSIHDFYTLGTDQNWKMTKKVDERDPHGYPRWLYQYHNISFLKYENKDRGILTLEAPTKDGDFKMLTVEGISFDSSSDEARNAFQDEYFNYDGQSDKGNLKYLKYKHSRGLAFDDLLEIYFDKQGKIVRLRYGVLGEN